MATKKAKGVRVAESPLFRNKGTRKNGMPIKRSFKEVMAEIGPEKAKALRTPKIDTGYEHGADDLYAKSTSRSFKHAAPPLDAGSLTAKSTGKVASAKKKINTGSVEVGNKTKFHNPAPRTLKVRSTMANPSDLKVRVKSVTKTAAPRMRQIVAKTSGASAASHAAYLHRASASGAGSDYAKQARKGMVESLKHVNKALGRTTNAALGVGGAAGRQATTHTMQRGKKGGSFYVVNGRKIYAKK